MQKVNLNLIPGGVRPVVNVSQYDEGRQFQLAIFQGSASYDLTGKTVTIEVGKTDGNGCAYGTTDLVNGVPVVAVSGNLVTITTPRQMTACAGENLAELKIAASGNEIGTLNFVLLCEQSALSPDTPISETEIPAIIAGAEEAASHYPYIDSTSKNWFVWSVEQGAFVDTGVRAEGIDGQGSVQTVNSVLPDANGNVSLLLNGSFSDILPIANGGTGNSVGYIQTGKKSGTTIGSNATAEGVNTTSSGGQGSHAEGHTTTASGPYSHAEGYGTQARANGSHAEGQYSYASGNYSHASGYYATAQYDCQTAIGKYNKNESDSLFEIGNGTSTSDYKNALAVKNDGRVVINNKTDALAFGSNLAVVEQDRTMTAQRTAGSYVYVVSDGKTYHIDTTISASGTLTPGTNATEAIVFDAISQLNSDIANKTYLVPTVIGNDTAIKTFADSYVSGDRINWATYYSGNADAPSAYDGLVQVIHSSSNYKTVIAFSRDGNIYVLQKQSTWKTWKTITMT